MKQKSDRYKTTAYFDHTWSNMHFEHDETFENAACNVNFYGREIQTIKVYFEHTG